jgi:hypothetical protein
VPAQLALGLGVGCAAEFGHEHDAGLSRGQPSDEPRHTHRFLGAQLRCKFRQPLGDRGRVVIDDVVDTAAAVLHRCDRGLGGVGDVDERPHAAAVTDDRELAPADHLELFGA